MLRIITTLVCILAWSCELRAVEAPVMASVETTLATASPQIRMFAFDGDELSYFASAGNPKVADHFTLVFDKAVALHGVSVLSGRANGNDALENGVVEVSEDGKAFHAVATFAEGRAKAAGLEGLVRAVRVKASADLAHPLAIREFKIESEPAVAVFKYPVEVFTDAKEAPELTEWAEKTARVCERAYQMICEELKSDGFTPKTVVTMTMKNDYDGVAYTAGTRIVGAVKYFKPRQKDVGAVVHEMVHVAQQYRGRGNPGWLVEGVADYIRNFKWEPQTKLRPVDPSKIKYDGSYQISARFLAFLTEKYDKEIVRKLNQAMREGKYKEELFEELTKKKLGELDGEWKEALRKG